MLVIRVAIVFKTSPDGLVSFLLSCGLNFTPTIAWRLDIKCFFRSDIRSVETASFRFFRSSSFFSLIVDFDLSGLPAALPIETRSD